MTEQELQHIRDNTRTYSPRPDVQVIVTPLGVDVIHGVGAGEFFVSVETHESVHRQTSSDHRHLMLLGPRKKG